MRVDVIILPKGRPAALTVIISGLSFIPPHDR